MKGRPRRSHGKDIRGEGEGRRRKKKSKWTMKKRWRMGKKRERLEMNEMAAKQKGKRVLGILGRSRNALNETDEIRNEEPYGNKRENLALLQVIPKEKKCNEKRQRKSIKVLQPHPIKREKKGTHQSKVTLGNKTSG